MNFEKLGIMIDNSRNAVMKPQIVKKVIDTIEKMGYNFLMLYTEDTYEVDNQPYFGHLRGRYSKEELCDLDAYAQSKGIELIPCIQTLAHLNALMNWSCYLSLRDCNDILCVGEDGVYELIEDMFATLDSCFTSRTVNIGMDEAGFIGLGSYLEKHGPKDRTEILLSHLKRVSEIAAKYNFNLLMWGDMFFKLAGNGDYYNSNLNESLKDKIPSNVTLIYWDYFSHSKERYDNNIKKHQLVQPEAWFAGGAWTWSGFTPHNTFSLKANSMALSSCAEHGVKNVILTLWGDNGGECSRFSVLPSLYAASQNAKGNFDEELIKQGFKDMFGIEFDDFMQIDLLGSPNYDGMGCMPKNYLYNDCFMGLYDGDIETGSDKKYAECAKKLACLTDDPEYGIIFRSAKALCEVLSIKCEIGINTRAAYKSGDKKAVADMLPVYDELLRRTEAFYNAFEAFWMWENKPHGFDVQDIRIGGLIRRISHCKERLEKYVNGEIDIIEELEEPVLPYGKKKVRWNQSATANTI